MRKERIPKDPEVPVINRDRQTIEKKVGYIDSDEIEGTFEYIESMLRDIEGKFSSEYDNPTFLLKHVHHPYSDCVEYDILVRIIESDEQYEKRIEQEKKKLEIYKEKIKTSAERAAKRAEKLQKLVEDSEKL